VSEERYSDALVFATRIHRDQRRKGTDIPYISHLLAVSSLVLEHGGDEDQAIAGLLHDAVEDQGGMETEATIRARFGARVADIVMACTDTIMEPKPPWRERKEAYLANLETKSNDAILVSLADKVHNATAILEDYYQVGGAIWTRFRGGNEGTLWYYRSLSDRFSRRYPSALSQRLSRVVRELEATSN